jgi:hypothetical protein
LSMDSAEFLDFGAVDKLCALGFVHKGSSPYPEGEALRITITPKGMPLLDAILPQIVAIEPALTA